MEKIKNYCTNICSINGVETFIIAPSKYDDLINDYDLLKDMATSKERINPFIQTAKESCSDKIFFAFVNVPTKVEYLQWIPVLCYKSGNQFLHINYRTSWMCRECGNIMEKPLIMPIDELDTTFYTFAENKYPNIDPIFKKIKCPKCGKLLQNHLHIIE